MDIKQVIVNKEHFYGLGTDNKMYRWDYTQATWMPEYNTGEKQEPAQVFYPHREQGGSYDPFA